MQIESISVKNFRNYKNLNIKFNKNLNIFVGNNAQGKTNLLESIYVLAITKSHRMHIDNSLIKINEIFTKIVGNISSNSGDHVLEVLINIKGKSVKIDSLVVKKISDYISKLTVIIFYPDDLEIVKGSPSIRRKFLNIEIGQLNNKYLNILNDYNFLLKTRNEYLKGTNIAAVDLNYLEILTNQLVDKAILIYKYRYEFLNSIDEKASVIFKNITNGKILNILYKPNIEFDIYNEESIKKLMIEKFKKNIKREILQGTTIFGPHRDDFYFYIDDNEIKEYGSQGQQRLAVLCLKFAEIELFKEKTGEFPILLLDDIFSELDEIKKNNIIKYMNNDIQTFITTTDLNNIDSKLLKYSNIFTIENGEIIGKNI